MKLNLVHVKADGSAEPVMVRRARLVIGREKGCDVRIPIPQVSRHHCEVIVAGDQIRVRDMGSSNGTFVNRGRVEQADLAAGDLLCVGPSVFVVQIDDQPAEVDAKQAYEQGMPPPAAAAPQKAKAAATGRKVSEEDILDALDDSDAGDSSVGDFDFDDLEDEDRPKL